MFGLFGNKSSGTESCPRYYDIEAVSNFKNIEVLLALKKYHNIDLGSVQKLNKLLCEMRIIEKTHDGWRPTEYGRDNFSVYNDCSCRPDFWHKNIVDAIAVYCRTNGEC